MAKGEGGRGGSGVGETFGAPKVLLSAVFGVVVS